MIKQAGKGEVLGFEDIIEGRNYTVGARCISQTCTLFRIPKQTFLDAVNHDENVAKRVRNFQIERDLGTVNQIKQTKLVNRKIS